MAISFKRGDIYLAQFQKKHGDHSIYGIRPVIIVSNNLANKNAPIVVVVPLTSKEKKVLPTHIVINGYGLDKRSTILVEQITTLDKEFLIKKIGNLSGTDIMKQIDNCLKIQIDVA